MTGRTPLTERRVQVVVAAMELIVEARLEDFLAFLTPDRIADASLRLASARAETFDDQQHRVPPLRAQGGSQGDHAMGSETVSEATVRQYFRVDHRGRRFDRSALVSALLDVIGSAFVPPLYSWDSPPASSREALQDVFDHAWVARRFPPGRGLETLFFVALAAAPIDDVAQQALERVSKEMVGCFAERLGEVDDDSFPLIRRALWLAYARFGETYFWRTIDADQGDQLAATMGAAAILVEQTLIPGDKPISLGARDPEITSHGHRTDALGTYSTIASSALIAIEEAQFLDYFHFLTAARIAERAAVDRKTVANYFSRDDRPGAFDLPKLLTVVERNFEPEHQPPGLEDLHKRFDLLGAAVRRQPWQVSARPNLDRLIASVAALDRQPREPVEDSQQFLLMHHAILTIGCELTQRMIHGRVQEQELAGLARFSLDTFTDPSSGRITRSPST
jgi:hypothetical protein